MLCRKWKIYKTQEAAECNSLRGAESERLLPHIQTFGWSHCFRRVTDSSKHQLFRRVTIGEMFPDLCSHASEPLNCSRSGLRAIMAAVHALSQQIRRLEPSRHTGDVYQSSCSEVLGCGGGSASLCYWQKIAIRLGHMTLFSWESA